MLVERSRCNLYSLLYRSKHEPDDLQFLSKKQVVNFGCKRIGENFVSNLQLFKVFRFERRKFLDGIKNFPAKNEWREILNYSKTKNFNLEEMKENFLESAIEEILFSKKKKKR